MLILSNDSIKCPNFYPSSDANSEGVENQEGKVERSDNVPVLDMDTSSSEDEQGCWNDEGEEQTSCGKRRQASTGGPQSTKGGRGNARGRTRLRESRRRHASRRGQGSTRGRGGQHARRSRRSRSEGNERQPTPAKSFDDHDEGNQLPDFQPSRPPGVHLNFPVLRNNMTKAIHFSSYFLPSNC